MVAGLLRSVFYRPDVEQVRAQFHRFEAQLRERILASADYLANARKGQPSGFSPRSRPSS